MDWHTIEEHREFLKDSLRQTINFRFTDQHQGVPAPPVQKPIEDGQELIELPALDTCAEIRGTDLFDAIARRQSRRRFKSDHLSLIKLSFLLWSTQGIKRELAPGTALRTVPSAGCRHAFETYLLVTRVEGLDIGVYRYLPQEHALVMEYADADLVEKITPATLGQAFIASAPVTFVWTALPTGRNGATPPRPPGHFNGCRSCVPEPLPGGRSDRLWHLCRSGLPPGIDGRAGQSGWQR